MRSFKVLMGCLILLSACVVDDAFPIRNKTEARSVSSAISVRLKNTAGKAQAGVPYVLSLGTQEISRGQSDNQGYIAIPELLIEHAYLLQLGDQPIRFQRQIAPPPEGGQLEIVYPDKHEYLQGQIVNEQGQGIADAVVQLKSESTLSDATGHFAILKTEALLNEDVLRVMAPGYSKLQIALLSLPNDLKLRLPLLQQSRRLRWPEDSQFMGLSPQNWQEQSQTLREIAQTQGLEIKAHSPQENDLDPERDILLLMPPERAFSQQQFTQWNSFVQTGGKVIVLSEWAGFMQASPSHLQPLLHSLGFHAGNDSLSQSSTTLEVTDFISHALSEDIKTLAFMRSSSVGILNLQRGNNLMFASSENYQILALRGPQAVLSAGLVGLGKVIVLGDSSWLLDHDSDNNGIVNIAEADNAQLWENMLLW